MANYWAVAGDTNIEIRDAELLNTVGVISGWSVDQQDLIWHGSHLVVGAGSSRVMRIYDCSIPSAPQHVSSIDLTPYGGYNVRGMALNGDVLFFATQNDNWVFAADLSDPASPTILDAEQLPSGDGIGFQNILSYASFDANGNGVAVAPEYPGAIATWDVSDPTNLFRVAHVSLPDNSKQNYDVEFFSLNDNYAVTASWSAGFFIVDASIPAAPAVAGGISASDYPDWIGASDLAAHPTEQKFVGTTRFNGTAESGDDEIGNTLVFVDASTASTPTIIDELTIPDIRAIIGVPYPGPTYGNYVWLGEPEWLDSTRFVVGIEVEDWYATSGASATYTHWAYVFDISGSTISMSYQIPNPNEEYEWIYRMAKSGDIIATLRPTVGYIGLG